MPIRAFAIAALTLALSTSAHAALPDKVSVPLRSPKPDLVLTGATSPKDRSSCRDVPFRVPAGVVRLSVDLGYTGRDQMTVIDVGVSDPDGVRGWSGSNKSSFTLSRTDATPSYLPGPIRPGIWTLNLCIAAIRPGAQARYTAGVWFWRHGDVPAVSTFSAAPLKTEARWYRGDLHMHSAHSDGACTPSSKDGKVPCPLYRTVEAAEKRGLDFIALTDHNTGSQYNEARELQPAFDTVLLIPGVEVTTYQGHANVWGTTEPIDWHIRKGWGANDIFRSAADLHALVSINHPASPTDESCRGCGWSAPDTDWNKVQAIEVLNAGELAGLAKPGTKRASGEDFWDTLLDRGFRLTGVGGSDNHAVELGRFGVGLPTTAVFASELSEHAILAAIRAGHVFIDSSGSKDRVLELRAVAGSDKAMMGDSLPVATGAAARFTLHATHAKGYRFVVQQDGQPLPLADADLATDDETRSFEVKGDGRKHWVRADVVSATAPILIGNPIYLEGPR